MTLAGLPRAGAVSKLHDYKKRRKSEGTSEKTRFNGEQFEIFKPKNQKFQSSYGEQNESTTRFWRQKQNLNHVARKKLTSKIEKSIQKKTVWTLQE